MNQTKRVFPLLDVYLKQLKEAEKEKKQKAQQAYNDYLTAQILVAIDEGYTMLIDDIVKLLDLEEAYVRRKILESLDYIILPAGAAEVFTCENMPHLNFMQLRIRRWKKIYICKASFEKFMEKHLFIEAPYQKIRYDHEKGRYIPIANANGKEKIEYNAIAYHFSYGYRFIRKSNYLLYVSQKKTEAFYRKTKSDIICAYEENRIDKKRLEQEMALFSEAIRDNAICIEAYQNEVEKFAWQEGRIKFKLCLEEASHSKKNDIILYNR